MSIEELVKEVKAALDHRESFDCDSQEFESADQSVNELLSRLTNSEDIKEFTEIFNQTNHAGQ